MSTDHGGPVILKPISEVAEFIKRMLPGEIPEGYALKPVLENIAGERDIRRGVASFRDFLCVFCDRLISDGCIFAKPPKTPKSVTDYPFLYSVTDLLVEVGYNGVLSEDGGALLLTEAPKPSPKRNECVKFLTLCGFDFGGANGRSVTCPANPIVMTGLKALSIADIELREKRYVSDKRHDNILRCDYRALMAEAADMRAVLKDALHSLPPDVQSFALELHDRYTGKGMTCAATFDPFDVHFFFSDIRNTKRMLTPKDIYYLRVWEFSLSLRHGFHLVIRAKKTEKYADVIETFPPLLRELIARGYGCDRKLRNERCQNGCSGFRLPLNESILGISREIKTWLDNEG